MNALRCLLAAILITAALTGAVQGSRFIGSLRTTSGDSLAEQDGKLVLVRTRGGPHPQVQGLKSVWQIGSPYLQTSGKFLAMDPLENGQRFYLADKSSDSTKWVIEVLETISPVKPKKGSIDEKQMKEGTAGSKFRLSVFGGSSKGWYLAANEPTEEQEKALLGGPVVLGIRLVQDPKQALTFDYVDSTYYIIHK